MALPKTHNCAVLGIHLIIIIFKIEKAKCYVMSFLF